jgi:hypothetical protein
VVVLTLMRLPRLLQRLRRWLVAVLVVVFVVASIKKNEYF